VTLSWVSHKQAGGAVVMWPLVNWVKHGSYTFLVKDELVFLVSLVSQAQRNGYDCVIAVLITKSVYEPTFGYGSLLPLVSMQSFTHNRTKLRVWYVLLC